MFKRWWTNDTRQFVKEALIWSTAAGAITYGITSDTFLTLLAKGAFKYTPLKDKMNLDFKSLHGCIFCGKYIVKNIKISKSHYELEADEIAILFPFPNLISSLKRDTPLHFEEIQISGFRGFVKPEVPPTPDDDFVIDKLYIENANVDFYPKVEGEPLKIEMDKFVTKTPFNAQTTLYTIGFESNAIGRIDGSNISIKSKSRSEVEWQIENFPISIAKKFEDNLLFLVVKEGNFNLQVKTHKGPENFDIDASLELKNFDIHRHWGDWEAEIGPSVIQFLKKNNLDMKMNIHTKIDKNELKNDTPRTLIQGFQRALLDELNKRALEQVQGVSLNLRDAAIEFAQSKLNGLGRSR